MTDREFHVGDLVLYYPTRDSKEPHGDVREICSVGGKIAGTPIAFVSGITACVALTQLRLVKAVEDRDGFTGVAPRQEPARQQEFGF